MSRKPSLLATALKAVEHPPEPAPEVAAEPTTAVASTQRRRSERHAASYVPPSRVNKKARTHHLPPAYWETLEEISFRTRDERGKRIPQERLVAEALNLLFVKYNYPQVRDE